MDINKFKESLKSLAQKNAEFVKANFKTNNRQFTKSSFENCRSELFLSELYKQFKELCCGEMSAECFKRGVLRILSTYEDECKIIPSCLYVKAKTDLFPGRIIDDMVSLAYEPLLNIFYYSDQDFRLQYFHELLTYYYTILMQHLSSDVSSVLHSELWENLVKTSIPLVKLDLLLKLYDSSSFKCSSTVKTLIMELYEIIEYPEILIEDCYKIVENKLKSRNYKLLNL
ncbi:hypothetical protein JTB14_017853 [Gonioctena quinquepunctata]|nr:hypothetical protein JTB14_017853 [Gonioctena quinquepunctata]